ncbi:MAG: aminoacyl-tRNA hydrolase [Firmicutes bacterium]|nr:aminoacyl-tRNA hydrolase [Bacillota bacterium]
MKLIVGLGNPGQEYEKTRHNAGFMVIDRIAADLGIAVDKKLFRALVGQGHAGTEKIVLAKPQTYMNLSGEAAGALMRWFKLSPGDLMVIYDDLDLPPGKVRIRAGGGSGGHKGMQSIIENLATGEFPRFRIGIGRPAEPFMETAAYVLGRVAPEEEQTLAAAVELAAQAVVCAVRDGLEKAMNQYNRK